MSISEEIGVSITHEQAEHCVHCPPVRKMVSEAKSPFRCYVWEGKGATRDKATRG